MRVLVPIFLFGAISWALGLIVCGRLAWTGKSIKSIMVAAIIFFGGPFGIYYGIYFKQWLEHRELQADIAYVQELCEKYGRDTIYRTVKNVEGVFQMVAKSPNTDALWADQFGMKEPWAMAFGDGENYPAASLGTHGKGYWVVEQQPSEGSGPPYRRQYLVNTGLKIGNYHPYAPNKDEPAFDKKQIFTYALLSKYGYYTEDLSTSDLRKRWIGGGKITIYDLEKNEILAERVGYYKASGPKFKMMWSGGITCKQNKPTSLTVFIKSVLHPAVSYPKNIAQQTSKETQNGKQ